MKFINRTNNTVYLPDIDRCVEFTDGRVEEISSDDILKSEAFQAMIMLKGFEIVSINESRIERNLERVQKKMATLKKLTSTESLSKTKVEDGPIDESREVFIKGHFLEAGGYAKFNRNLALGLRNRGVNVKINILGSKSQINDEELSQINSLRGTPSRNAIKIDSMIPSFGSYSSGRHSILYTTIESNTIPPQFLDIARQYREIWVTSDFCKQVLQKAGLTQRISVMPCSIDTKLYTTDGDVYNFRPSLKPFVFVSVFNWSYRKGYDVLLKAYLNEFSGNDNVSLLLVSRVAGDSSKSDIIRQSVDRFIKECDNSNPPHIARCSKTIPESQMPALYRACNAFVLFSRGEGFGLPYCEASLCGLPIIGSRCSAQTMFLNDENSRLLEVDSFQRIAPGTMNVHYWDNQEFPSFNSQKSLMQARQLLRDVYSNYTAAKKRNEKLRKAILSNYSIDTVVEQVRGRLEEIWSKK